MGLAGNVQMSGSGEICQPDTLSHFRSFQLPSLGLLSQSCISEQNPEHSRTGLTEKGTKEKNIPEFIADVGKPHAPGIFYSMFEPEFGALLS